jgi:hypothetical protein
MMTIIVMLVHFKIQKKKRIGNADDEICDDNISVCWEFQLCAVGKHLEVVMQMFKDSLAVDMDLSILSSVIRSPELSLKEEMR